MDSLTIVLTIHRHTNAGIVVGSETISICTLDVVPVELLNAMAHNILININTLIINKKRMEDAKNN